MKVYYNGKPQPVNVAADKLKGTIRTAVPFKIGQRNTDQKLQFMTRRRPAAVRPRPVAARGRAARRPAATSSSSSPRPADERTAEEKAKALDWWLAAVDARSRELDARLKALQDEEVQIKARGTIAHVMNERTDEPMAFILYRGEYDQRRDR